MNDDTTYVLEKTWRIDTHDFKLDADEFYFALVRPCGVTYREYRNFVLGKRLSKTACITHGGSVAQWYSKHCSSWYVENMHGNQQFSTFEQFMIDLNVRRMIIPSIENWMFEVDFKSYVVKTIDLKTGETLYDGAGELLSELRAKNLI